MKKIISVCAVLAVSLFADDCKRAGELFQDAMKTKDKVERKVMLEQSLSECRGGGEPFVYDALVALGKLHANNGDMDKAKESFKNAIVRAMEPKYKANAFYLVGEVEKMQGNKVEATKMLKESIRIFRNDKAEKAIAELLDGADTVDISVADIKQAINSTKELKTRGLGACEPSVDVRIPFEYNKAAISSGGMALVKKLGETLSSDALSGYSFSLIGHTDGKGNDSYNNRLSEQRAASVKEYLVKNFKISPLRLVVVGKGKSELLISENSPKADAINRRVEIAFNENK